MYNWGYLKEAALAKLDLDESEASVQNLLSRFTFYANEAMTQICSAVKPKKSYVLFEAVNELPLADPNGNIPEQYIKVGELAKMPDDFISFNNEPPIGTYFDAYGIFHSGTEIHDDVYMTRGYAGVYFKQEGTFTIPYDARWITFYKSMREDTPLDAPMDVLECIPSYIASQCYKIDDEYKASVFRNEYEMFLARINTDELEGSTTLHIGGDW